MNNKLAGILVPGKGFKQSRVAGGDAWKRGGEEGLGGQVDGTNV